MLRLPALADVAVPSTARFVDAFADAQSLYTDRPTDRPPPQRTRFIAAVDAAERAWTAARDAAAGIRLSHFAPDERGTAERVITQLTTAAEIDDDAERLAAYAAARSELARLERIGILHLPRPAQVALETAHRPALPT